MKACYYLSPNQNQTFSFLENLHLHNGINESVVNCFSTNEYKKIHQPDLHQLVDL